MRQAIICLGGGKLTNSWAQARPTTNREDSVNLEAGLLKSPRLAGAYDSALAPGDGINFTVLDSFIESLHEWLKVCDERHRPSGSGCNHRLDHDHGPQSVHCWVEPITSRGQHDIPSWVIDTKHGCLVAGDTVPGYAALSYTWDAPPQNIRAASQFQQLRRFRTLDIVDDTPTERLVLERKDLDTFQQPGYLFGHVSEKIPMVVKDAMTLVSRAGTRYLWVDCLCVIQNDDSTQDQLGRMRAIYSGATYTIIAATSGKRLFGGFHLPNRYLRFNEANSSDAKFPEVANATVLRKALFDSYWATRGWTYQEYLLSARSIIFIDETYFWECQCAIWCAESSTLENSDRTVHHTRYDPDPSYNDWSHRFNGDQQRALPSFPLPDLGLYIELICQYNVRDLRFPQDELPAFSGVLDSLTQSMFPGGFVGALPNLFLNSALLWQPLRKGSRRDTRKQRNGSVAGSSPLPSWSWVGWKCPIDPSSLASCLGDRIRILWSGKTNTWITKSTVPWFAQTNASVPKQIIDGPDILEELKGFRANPDKTPLPEGWSRHDVSEEKTGWSGNISDLSLEKQLLLARWSLNFGDLSGVKTPEEMDRIAAISRFLYPDTFPKVFYTHHSTWPLLYQYPLPTQHAQRLNEVPTHATLLSCTTKKAALVVRDVHRYCDTLQIGAMVRAYAMSIDFCSVATLETKDGSWAGVLRLMDDQTRIGPGMEIQTISISTGSTTNKEAGRSYEEQIDRTGCWADNIQHHHFSSIARGEKQDQQSEYSPFKGEPRDRGPLFHLYGGFCPQQTNMKDVHEALVRSERPGTGKDQERYEFHNILWVETREGIMYRKAAGRVPKEIWEKNCGEPEEIVLG